ncbi:hypothetical protein [Paramaledivibacter caminithermalis]|uniref:Uncharacterized protein n=1 Tax=Paramaledivibacter caminithermalis (strain DSM 15212 / CIP 107654 / DViRD3) TaxID=1121301 RepID=A0A1M6SZ19_PARC5|nr:hypothetical protein [Paramaledivibacter caminithermalis]SHK49944.1 hypothetical protein SAMN02745912_03493 [Paramaledivibacter caminithermalis DSM 15212]
MNFIEDIILTNKGIVLKSFKLSIKNWKIFLVGFTYFIISFLMWTVASYAWILGGIIVALFQSAIISNYIYLIENIINYEGFSLEDFKSGFTVYLRNIYSIIIIFWFVRFGASLFLKPIFYINIGGLSLWSIIQIVAVILLNPLPETIYQKYHAGLDAITYSFDFIKENWLEWFIPNGFIIAVLYLIHISTNKMLIILGFSTNIFISSTFTLIVYSVVYQILLCYAMIYRGQLFNILSTSTRRKRMFMRNMYK